MESFRAARTRRTNARNARRSQRPVHGQVDDNTKALRGMLSVQTVVY